MSAFISACVHTCVYIVPSCKCAVQMCRYYLLSLLLLLVSLLRLCCVNHFFCCAYVLSLLKGFNVLLCLLLVSCTNARARHYGSEHGAARRS